MTLNPHVTSSASMVNGRQEIQICGTVIVIETSADGVVYVNGQQVERVEETKMKMFPNEKKEISNE